LYAKTPAISRRDIAILTCLGGEGKITYTFSANANVLSANFPFSVLPAGGEGVGFSMLAEHYGERIHCFTPPPCLGPFRRRDTDRIISIYVAMPKVAKASTKMSLLRVVVFGFIAALSPM
jgi:hypothetical protein